MTNKLGPRRWSRDELSLLKLHYKDNGTEIPELLSYRNRNQIQKRAAKLGLKFKRRARVNMISSVQANTEQQTSTTWHMTTHAREQYSTRFADRVDGLDISDQFQLMHLEIEDTDIINLQGSVLDQLYKSHGRFDDYPKAFGFLCKEDPRTNQLTVEPVFVFVDTTIVTVLTAEMFLRNLANAERRRSMRLGENLEFQKLVREVEASVGTETPEIKAEPVGKPKFSKKKAPTNKQAAFLPGKRVVRRKVVSIEDVEIRLKGSEFLQLLDLGTCANLVVQTEGSTLNIRPDDQLVFQFTEEREEVHDEQAQAGG